MLKGDWEKEMQKAAKRIVLFFTIFVNLSCFYSTPFTEAVSPSTVFERIPTGRFLHINWASYQVTSGAEFDQGYPSFLRLFKKFSGSGIEKKTRRV